MKYLLLLSAICISQLLQGQNKSTNQQKVAALLSKMTLEEKVGQMTQVTLGVVCTNKDGVLDTNALKKAILQYKVGSILNTTNRALSVKEWKIVLTQMQDLAGKTRLHIPIIYGLDAIHGQTYTLNSTLFPQNIALAATRDSDLVKKIAKVTAKELRASGVRWNYAPVLDAGRQPLWSRFPETYGEDVFIGKSLGAAAVRAYEEDGLSNKTSVASCLKHYIGYSASRTGKDRTPIYLPEIELREYYLPQFREAVKAGASSVMINSSEINGVPVHASKYLLTEVLRKELGFEGLIVSDWEDVIRLHTRHMVAATPLDAVVMSVNAGIDMSMVPNDFSFYDLLLEAVHKKKVTIERINEAVSRILMLKMKLGLFENPYPENIEKEFFGLPDYQDLALQAAREAMTLLKNNNNALPLDKKSKFLIAGPAAKSITALNGAWSYTWQGNNPEWYPKDSKNIFDAISAKIGQDHVSSISSVNYDDPINYDTTQLKSAAVNSDAIILCLGENAYAESPGNIRDLALPDNQLQLAKAAINTGKKVILILSEGRPRLISSIEPEIPGILMSYWSGKKSAEAIADVIFGDYNPSGKLPYSYPRSMGEMVLYDRKPTEDYREIFNENVLMNGYDPLFPFGWGLSYTTFEYSDIHINKMTIKGKEPIQISVVVKNNGANDGWQNIELYSKQLYASITPNVKRLRAFQRVFLKAGESKKLSFTLTKNDLAFVNAQLKTVTEPGVFELMIGDKKVSFSYEQ